jgi:hypothetical protein
MDATNARLNLQVGNLQAAMESTEIAFFAQDSWRLLPNFTLNFGLRYEAQFNPDPEATNTDLVDKVVEFGEFPIGVSIDPREIADVTDQWAPRLGFAWDPFNDSKTVVRGYGGIYYARTPLLLFADAINNYRETPGNVSITLPFPVTGDLPRTLYDQLLLIGVDLNNFPLGSEPIITPAQAAALAAELGFAPDPLLNANVTTMAKDFTNPRSYQFGIGFERELMTGWTAGADFTYVKTVHLERNRDLNLPAPALLTTRPASGQDQIAFDAGVPVYIAEGRTRPLLGLSQVQIRESTAKALYRAFTLRTKYDRSWGQFNVFYTLSKNLSDDDNERTRFELREGLFRCSGQPPTQRQPEPRLRHQRQALFGAWPDDGAELVQKPRHEYCRPSNRQDFPTRRDTQHRSLDRVLQPAECREHSVRRYPAQFLFDPVAYLRLSGNPHQPELAAEAESRP